MFMLTFSFKKTLLRLFGRMLAAKWTFFMKKYFLLVLAMFTSSFMNAKEPIVTAEKLLQYKIAAGHMEDFQAPEIVLVCYQRSTMQYLLEKHPEFKPGVAP